MFFKDDLPKCLSNTKKSEPEAYTYSQWTQWVTSHIHLYIHVSLRHGYFFYHSLLYFNIEIFKTICHLIFSL